jgi:formate dehydrogenase subunit gamma
MSDITPIERGDAITPGEPPVVHRYRLETRINHWINAVAMTLMVLSGLSMFHPSLFFLTVLFGGGQNTRAIHPWIGVFLVLSFILLVTQFWRANLWNRSDTAWVAHSGDLMLGHEEKMPEAGKYNAGQKFIFWAMVILISVLFATGIVIWNQYFSDLTGIEFQRFAVLVHSVAAVGAIGVLILHVYAAIWVRGSFHAMISGSVSAGWAWRHHRKWFRQLAALAGGEQKRSGVQ